jgi:hypothetical protein
VGLLWTAIGIWTSYSQSPVALALAGLWYGIRERLRNMIMPVYGLTAVAGACVIGWLLYWLATKLFQRLADSKLQVRHVTAGAALALFLGLNTQAVQQSSWGPLREDLLRRAPVGPEYAQTYRWLQKHTEPDALVAYDRHLEFMTWSYADFGTGLLFGLPPLVPSSATDYEERWRVFYWLVDAKDAKPAGCLVRSFNVQYVAVGGRRMPAWDAHYSRRRLAASDKVELAHWAGDLRVYRVTDAGRACP